MIGFNLKSFSPFMAVRSSDLVPFAYFETQASAELTRVCAGSSQPGNCHSYVNLLEGDRSHSHCLLCHKSCKIPGDITAALFHLAGPKSGTEAILEKIGQHLKAFKPRRVEHPCYVRFLLVDRARFALVECGLVDDITKEISARVAVEGYAVSTLPFFPIQHVAIGNSKRWLVLMPTEKQEQSHKISSLVSRILEQVQQHTGKPHWFVFTQAWPDLISAVSPKCFPCAKFKIRPSRIAMNY